MLRITLPHGVESGIRQIVEGEMVQCVGVLAEKFGFSAEEALKHLCLDELKFVKKRGPIPKMNRGPAVVSKPQTPFKTTGYLLFSKTMRDSVRSELATSLGADQKLSPQDVVKELAARWQALSGYEKREWSSHAESPEPTQPAPVPLVDDQPSLESTNKNLSMTDLQQFQANSMAHEVAIEFDRMTVWTVEEAIEYFESNGLIAPDNRPPTPIMARRQEAQHSPEWYLDELPVLEPKRQDRPTDHAPGWKDEEPMISKVESDSGDESDELEVTPFEIAGKRYLKDDENNLYYPAEPNEAELIGVWNPVTREIEFDA